MGFDARTIGRLTLFEFLIQLDGWKEANGIEDKPNAPSQAEFEAADWDF